MDDYNLHVLYHGPRMYVGKYAEEDGRRILNDACEVRSIVMGPGNIQEQGLMLGKLYIPTNGDLMVKLIRDSVYYKLYLSLTGGIKLVP